MFVSAKVSLTVRFAMPFMKAAAASETYVKALALPRNAANAPVWPNK
jgi:hypothetical protein